MVRVTPFLLLLSLALVAPGFSAKKCPLEGYWRNKEGHILTIWSVGDPSCACDGSYRIGSMQYQLKERWLSMDKMIIFGFKVYWSSDYRTVYESWYQNQGGKATLNTNWRKEYFDGYMWRMISTGNCNFTRLSPCSASGIAGDFKGDGNAWDANPISGCSATCF